MHGTVIDFGREQLRKEFVYDKRVLSIGADVEWQNNIIKGNPKEFYNLYGHNFIAKWKEGYLDIVTITETLEGIKDWGDIINPIKSMLKEGGTLILTVRPKANFEDADIKTIFKDFDIKVLVYNNEFSGVLMRAVKPKGWKPTRPKRKRAKINRKTKYRDYG